MKANKKLLSEINKEWKATLGNYKFPENVPYEKGRELRDDLAVEINGAMRLICKDIYVTVEKEITLLRI